ncbi:response regulator receiver domain protein [Bacteriovorax sp. BSW11_IV]|uniref:response regulator n=1 Tax=Bacteriovorax sp. BSW11_IV TaxID=1353529 RepID=UPI00038A2689|nr:response regulator [Bacteriovorax sp. BSW11_IV]EQC49473.1 response regulator receiver domain protein [Bacteriovorax sp. BSW11_IV]
MANDAKILFIDDEVDLLELFQFFMERHGINATYSSNPQEALGLIQDKHFDFIFSDVKMPGLSGLQLLEKVLLAGSPFGHFVFVTAYKNLSKEEVIEMGATDILYKPISIKNILSYIQNHPPKN